MPQESIKKQPTRTSASAERSSAELLWLAEDAVRELPNLPLDCRPRRLVRGIATAP
jgi:hypothetical protein